MKAWQVGNDGTGYVLVRAEPRGKARTMHPDHSRYDGESFTGQRALRMPKLDGPGPARELDWVDKRCEHPNATAWGDCPDCFEGFVLDLDATIAANTP